jgi:hypothetical protein
VSDLRTNPAARAQPDRTVLQQDQAMSASRPDMTNLQPTIWRSSNSRQSEFGCTLISPRPSPRLTYRRLARLHARPNPRASAGSMCRSARSSARSSPSCWRKSCASVLAQRRSAGTTSSTAYCWWSSSSSCQGDFRQQRREAESAPQACEKTATLTDRVHRGNRQNPHVSDLILIKSRWKLPVPEDNGRLVVIVAHLGIAGG